MEKIKDIDKNQLRFTVEEAFRKAGKDKMSSNEIKELLGSSYTKQQFGGFIVRLTSDKVLVKDSAEPLKVGKQRFNYYRLVPKELNTEQQKTIKEDIYIIFNETTQDSEKISGQIELNKRVNEILDGNNFELSIFKQVSKVKNAPKFENV